MFSRFFIEHPRFAFVVSIVITLAGLISIAVLPVAQYPNFVPSQVSITATYPGADAKTVQETVVQPIETQVNGVKKMLYISSTSTDTGSATITVTFGIGTDGDSNTVNTQNRVNWADAQLPEEVRRQSVIVKEKSSSMLAMIAVYSPNGEYDDLFLNNFASINLKDELARISGVGDVSILGERKYSMRIWLDVDKLAYLKMTVDDVSNAITAQNVQVSAGAVGDAPAPDGQVFRYALQTQGRMTQVEEFKKIVIRSTNEGEQVRLGDVARVELGAESYSSVGSFNGKPAALLAVYQLNDANGLEIIKAVHGKLAELKPYFPAGIECAIPFDTTDFINASISEVVETLFIAVLLVILVTYLFLQDWRSTLVPTVAIPVSLVGTFAVLLVIGFTINLITLFGLILAIGIVVDDAIVVIENVNRLMEQEHLSPKAAAIKSMEQVTGPVIATTLVLLAMFVPVCFLAGITGEMYRQFGITISVAVVISSINALTLSPALSAMLLRPIAANRRKFVFFRWFDALFERLTSGYGRVVAPLIRHASLMMLFYAGLTALALFMYGKLPTGFIPDEDQGKIFVNVQLPDAASLNRSIDLTDELVKICQETPGVKEVIAVPGYSILTGSQASNNSLLIVALDDWDKRPTDELQQNAICAALNRRFAAVKGASVAAFGMPVIQGIGQTSGFSFVVEDTTGTDAARLQQAIDSVCSEANRDPALTAVFSTFSSRVPQLFLEIDREKAMKLGIDIADINSALQGMTGYTYVNDFNKYGKVYKVEIQADASYRDSAAKLHSIYVRNSAGEMAPLSTLVKISMRTAPQYLNRYNLYSSATINGNPAPGYSSGQAMQAMQAIAARTLPEGMKFEWTDMSYQELEAGRGIAFSGVEIPMMGVIIGLALFFMYLFLVAQYESWMLPFAVILSVPIAFFGALVALWCCGIENNIYTQVGFVLLFGIACKTAILIVEFAKQKYDEGTELREAATFAAKLRFRAVLMTAVSFILGTFPLVIATGASAVSRRSLGTAVFGGMVAAVLVGTMMIPAFFVVVQSIMGLVCVKKAKE
ncbi:MAG: multidrug efflux RND transporter permease subunit [Victivallaceae bacterium]|nr:multidrug efflux RND transporter permease subunit [Victivallaceae bacterium]